VSREIVYVYIDSDCENSFRSCSDLFIPNRFRCNRLLLHLIILTVTHTYTHSVRRLWKRDLPVAENSDWRHNTHKIQLSIPPAVFEPSIPAYNRPQTPALDPTAIRIGTESKTKHWYSFGKMHTSTFNKSFLGYHSSACDRVTRYSVVWTSHCGGQHSSYVFGGL